MGRRETIWEYGILVATLNLHMSDQHVIDTMATRYMQRILGHEMTQTPQNLNTCMDKDHLDDILYITMWTMKAMFLV